jgi:hypothetical protein
VGKIIKVYLFYLLSISCMNKCAAYVIVKYQKLLVAFEVRAAASVAITQYSFISSASCCKSLTRKCH